MYMAGLVAVVVLLGSAVPAAAQATSPTGVLGAGHPLHPGDQIRISFEREPDLGGEFMVDETGHAVLPLLGRWPVTQYPAGRLKDTLTAEYDAQLRNQAVQIVLTRRVRVIGAVQRPGLYQVDPTMSFGDVVALAGGATDNGKPDEIRILRDGEEIRANLTVADPLLADLRSGDQVMVPERSWFSRNSRWLVPSLLSASIITTIRIVTR